jgi:hypothetical protein
MTTPATGKLAWGQAGNYDASDDRGVITAVTAGRIGLVRPVRAEAGAGLQILIRGGWVGVASCYDFTSGVIGSREDMVVDANPGEASDSRQDVVWATTNPDEGTFTLSVMPRAATGGLSGIPLVNIVVPSGANLANQMTLTSVDAAIERRVLSVTYMTSGQGMIDYVATTPGAAANRALESLAVWIEPGQWYRVRYYAACPSVVGGPWPPQTLEGRIGIFQRTAGQPILTAQLMRGAVICWARGTVPVIAEIDYVFRHDLRDPGVQRVFDGRIWTNGNGTIRPGGYTELGPYVQTLTVEDIGS